MHPNSLFDSASTWLSSPREAFAAFLLSPDFSDQPGRTTALRDSSIKIYLARWTKFIAWLETTEHTLATLSPLSLQPFLAGMSPASRYRYVRMLERVFDHLIQLNLRQDNPARALAIKSPVRGDQGHLDTQLLTPAQQTALRAALPAPSSWKKARDRAMISLILGAGLRVNEVLNLKITQVGRVESDGTLPVEVFPQGAGRRHRTRIQPFAVQDVMDWLKKRADLEVTGLLLFPAGIDDNAPLHPSSVYRLVARVLAKAGIPEDHLRRRGARTLRSTFAVNELSAGAPIAHLGELLGHQSDRSTRRYVELAKRTGQQKT